MEIETWLRMAKLPYQNVVATVQNFSLAPKGKIPFIEYKGKLVGDSNLIIEMFKKQEGIDLDASLSASERAISHAFRRMIKENIYWAGIHIRYDIPENWQGFREVLGSTLFTDPVTPEQWQPVAEGIRKTMLARMSGQGIGVHNSEEIDQIITADLQSLSDFLADKPFFMGEEPTTLDVTAYSHIGNFLKPPYASPIVDYLRQLPNLCQHYDRMINRFFPS